jgi:TraY domain
MKQGRKSRGGRPRREPDPGERVKLGLRVTPEVKAQLDAAAEQNGRSQSQEAELRLERSFEQDPLLEGFGRLEAALKGVADKLRPSPTAEYKAMGLLKKHLTPRQREQFEQHHYFDVIGGNSDKTYRIHEGWQMNVAELKDGMPVVGLCFVPKGNLPAGDVMLAQKLALELSETETLTIANKFDVSPDWPKMPEIPEKRKMLRISRRILK